MTDLDKIIRMLYRGQGATGVTREGYYQLDEKLFRHAAEEYLITGKNYLPELDTINYASWYERRMYGRKLWRPIIDKKEHKILTDFLEGKGFWHDKFYPDNGIVPINKYLSDAEVKK